MNEKPKKIEVINGNGKELDISEVSTHISGLKPKNKENKEQKIVIPEVKKNTCMKNK